MPKSQSRIFLRLQYFLRIVYVRKVKREMRPNKMKKVKQEDKKNILECWNSFNIKYYTSNITCLIKYSLLLKIFYT